MYDTNIFDQMCIRDRPSRLRSRAMRWPMVMAAGSVMALTSSLCSSLIVPRGPGDGPPTRRFFLSTGGCSGVWSGGRASAALLSPSFYPRDAGGATGTGPGCQAVNKGPPRRNARRACHSLMAAGNTVIPHAVNAAEFRISIKSVLSPVAPWAWA